MTINLNYLHVLTIVLVIAKLWEKIDWTWTWVFMPSIVSVVLSIVVFVIAFLVIFISQLNR